MPFIVIEGQDYVGKTTQTKLLVERLCQEGLSVHQVRSPGGSPDAEVLRECILHANASPSLRNILTGLSRTLTGAVVTNFLQTPSQKTRVVVSDRWITSGYAYQVEGERVPVDAFNAANKDVPLPDIEIRLMMSATERAKRKAAIANTDSDVMEIAESDPEFAQRVQKVFEQPLPPCGNYPVVMVYIQHNASVESIHNQVWTAIQSVLPL